MGAEPTLEGPRGPSLEVAQSRARLGASQTLARRVGAAPAGSRAHSGRPICVTGFRRRQQEQDVSCFSSAEKEALPPPPATANILKKTLHGNGLPYYDRNGGNIHIFYISEW